MFGAASQYVGSLSAVNPALTDLSVLSAPWLVLPFLVGCTQREWRSGALLGLACTFAGLFGYGAMTLSPMQGAHYTAQSVSGFIVSNGATIAGGTITGPLFGWFGQRWRNHRDYRVALLTSATLCLEPLVRQLVEQPPTALGRWWVPAIQPIGSRNVAVLEVTLGLAAAAYVGARALASAPDRSTNPPAA
jgi:hypothetical protein